jgi:hypothetical protein
VAVELHSRPVVCTCHQVIGRVVLCVAVGGNWEVRKPGADRASAVTRTQAEGLARAREILGNGGGGEMEVRALDGALRAQDTIPPRPARYVWTPRDP